MKQSPLFDTIQRLHDGNVTMAGYVDTTWKLPAYFGPRGQAQAAVAEEYAVLTGDAGVAIADRSWRSTIELKGRDRLAFLQGMLTNDIAKLTPGDGCRAAMLNSNAQILADVVVHALDDRLLLTVDPRAAARLLETLDKYLIAEKVVITDISDKTATITIDGGGAVDALKAIVDDLPLPENPFGNVSANIDGVDVMVVTRSGPRGFVNYDLRVPAELAPSIWEKLVVSGAKPVGEMALEIVRVEAGDPAWGSELDPLLLFPEAEVAESMSYTKGCYVGQEIIARIHARGHVNKGLRAIVFDDVEDSMQLGDPLYPVETESSEPSREIGKITSAVTSPMAGGRTLALGYVRKEHNTDGTRVICRYAHKEALGTVKVISVG